MPQVAEQAVEVPHGITASGDHAHGAPKIPTDTPQFLKRIVLGNGFWNSSATLNGNRVYASGSKV